MMNILSRLDKTVGFCDADDFYQDFEQNYQNQLKLLTDDQRKLCQSRLSISEVMTIVILFHGSGYKTFKEFYLKEVFPHWKADFPKLVSYNRIGSLMPWSLMVLSCFLSTRRGKMTGIAFIDSTPMEVCHNCRAHLPQGFWRLTTVGQKFRWLVLRVQITFDYQ